MTQRAILTDSLWKPIFRFLRAHPKVRVGNSSQLRLFLEGCCWILRTGAQWRELPRRFGKWDSVYQRYRRWAQNGIWTELMASVADCPDLENLMLDSTVVRAHPCAAGAKGGKILKLSGALGAASAAKSLPS